MYFNTHIKLKGVGSQFLTNGQRTRNWLRRLRTSEQVAGTSREGGVKEAKNRKYFEKKMLSRGYAVVN